MRNAVTSFERLVRLFRRMIYVGMVVIVLGVGVSFAFSGAARYFVAAGSVGASGLMIFVGVRESRRGKVMLDRIRSETPRE
jgi:hypothetical protein